MHETSSDRLRDSSLRSMSRSACDNMFLQRRIVISSSGCELYLVGLRVEWCVGAVASRGAGLVLLTGVLAGDFLSCIITINDGERKN